MLQPNYFHAHFIHFQGSYLIGIFEKCFQSGRKIEEIIDQQILWKLFDQLLDQSIEKDVKMRIEKEHVWLKHFYKLNEFDFCVCCGMRDVVEVYLGRLWFLIEEHCVVMETLIFDMEVLAAITIVKELVDL